MYKPKLRSLQSWHRSLSYSCSAFVAICCVTVQQIRDVSATLLVRALVPYIAPYIIPYIMHAWTLSLQSQCWMLSCFHDRPEAKSGSCAAQGKQDYPAQLEPSSITQNIVSTINSKKCREVFLWVRGGIAGVESSCSP